MKHKIFFATLSLLSLTLTGYCSGRAVRMIIDGNWPYVGVFIAATCVSLYSYFITKKRI